MGNNIVKNNDKVYRAFIFLFLASELARLYILPSYSITVYALVVSFLLLWSLFSLFSHRHLHNPVSTEFDKNILRLFLGWQVFIIVRGIGANYSSFSAFVSSSFTNPYGTLAFLMPFSIYLGVEKFNYRMLIKVSVLALIIYLISVYLFRIELFLSRYTLTAAVSGEETYSDIVSVVSQVNVIFTVGSFLLFLPKYINRKIWYFAVGCLLLSIAISAIGARRSSIALGIMLLFSSFFLYYLCKKGVSKIYRFIVIAIILSLASTYVAYNFNSRFSLLSERGFEDSRSGVVNEYWKDVATDGSWIWGRGLNGYYKSGLSSNDIGHRGERNLCETGYLYIMLSGGIISLGLYLIIMIRAAYFGWFCSNNFLTKGFALFIFVHLINLIPFGLPSFKMTFFLIWTGVGVCLSKQMRSYSDEDIKQLYFSKWKTNKIRIL